MLWFSEKILREIRIYLLYLCYICKCQGSFFFSFSHLYVSYKTKFAFLVGRPVSVCVCILLASILNTIMPAPVVDSVHKERTI